MSLETYISDLKQLYAQAADELHKGWIVFNDVYFSKMVPEPEKLFNNAWTPTVLSILLANIILLIVFPKGRKFLFDFLDTVVACILVFLMVTIVIGLPIGAVYLTMKAIGYIFSSLATVEPVARILNAFKAA